MFLSVLATFGACCDVRRYARGVSTPREPSIRHSYRNIASAPVLTVGGDFSNVRLELKRLLHLWNLQREIICDIRKRFACFLSASYRPRGNAFYLRRTKRNLGVNQNRGTTARNMPTHCESSAVVELIEFLAQHLAPFQLAAVTDDNKLVAGCVWLELLQIHEDAGALHLESIFDKRKLGIKVLRDEVASILDDAEGKPHTAHDSNKGHFNQLVVGKRFTLLAPCDGSVAASLVLPITDRLRTYAG